MKNRFLVTIVFILLLLSGCNRESRSAPDVVRPCDVPVSRDLQEASFIVAYRFDVNAEGAPRDIKKVKNDYLPDEPFASCIAEWKLPSLKSEATATFYRKPAEGGWTEVVVTGKAFNRTYRYDAR